jgi:hypothetical protein
LAGHAEALWAVLTYCPSQGAGTLSYWNRLTGNAYGCEGPCQYSFSLIVFGARSPVLLGHIIRAFTAALIAGYGKINLARIG